MGIKFGCLKDNFEDKIEFDFNVEIKDVVENVDEFKTYLHRIDNNIIIFMMLQDICNIPKEVQKINEKYEFCLTGSSLEIRANPTFKIFFKRMKDKYEDLDIYSPAMVNLFDDNFQCLLPYRINFQLQLNIVGWVDDYKDDNFKIIKNVGFEVVENIYKPIILGHNVPVFTDYVFRYINFYEINDMIVSNVSPRVPPNDFASFSIVISTSNIVIDEDLVYSLQTTTYQYGYITGSIRLDFDFTKFILNLKETKTISGVKE